ncbi:hypothetical protein GGD66_006991 [Bradyrhizobium sp. CIR48]|nr:hypothetical protein [Bradyrhizobium sp. CIR48]
MTLDEYLVQRFSDMNRSGQNEAFAKIIGRERQTVER